MVLLAAEVVGIFMRWAHIASVALLIGGIAYARAVAVPVLTGNDRFTIFERLAARYRPVVYAAIAGIVVSGLYGVFTRTGHTRYYHMWFGIKMLLALHVFAAAILSVRPTAGTEIDEAKRGRRMTGVVVSGLLVILIAAYLRRIY
jgi:hypothetical protein